jgi:uncharacterized membrane protein (UPF0127 family)
MKSHVRLLAVIACAWWSCFAAAADFAPSQLRDFPRDTLSIQHGDRTDAYQIWLANTPEQQQQGLMFLTELPPGYGMLFPQSPPRVMTMWMKNTFIPLDMLFIGSDGRILRIAHDATPQSTDIISSGMVISAVLELRGGETRLRGIREGDRVLHPSFGPGTRLAK